MASKPESEPQLPAAAPLLIPFRTLEGRNMTEQLETPQNDSIGAPWEDVRKLPVGYPERSSFLRLIGDVEGSRVLDLACGDGFYTRQIAQLGARRSLGVDVSSAMIEAAGRAEDRDPHGAEFLVADAAQPELSQLGDFDLVTAAYLVNHAKSMTELTDMCRGAWSVLAEDGRFVGVTQHPWFSFDGPGPDPYGFVFDRQRDTEFGTYVRVTAALEPPFRFHTCVIRPEVYEEAFATAGFSKLTWVPVSVGDEGLQRFGEDFWEDFLANPPIMMFEAHY